MKSVLFVLLLLFPTITFAQKHNGLNIDIYKKICGFWFEAEYAKPLDNCDMYGSESCYASLDLNGFLAIDIVNDMFNWGGLHSCPFINYIQISPDKVNIELNLLQKHILKYNITIGENGDISFLDIGSTTDYSYPKRKLRKVIGPNFKNNKYGNIKGESVR